MNEDSLGAVRERIAEMRSAAAEDRASAAGWRDDIDGPDTEHAAYNERRAESLEWAANALEAVLVACDLRDVTPETFTRDSSEPYRHGFNKGSYSVVCYVRAALTRATATTEGAR